MILGLDDIPGGSTFISFLVWLALTGMFYLVTYVAALNVLDDLTRNSFLKIPAMWAVSIISAGLMTILHYKPWILGVLIAVANYYRVNNLARPENPRFQGIAVNKPLFFIASYGYIGLVLALTWYLQLGGGLQGPEEAFPPGKP